MNIIEDDRMNCRRLFIETAIPDTPLNWHTWKRAWEASKVTHSGTISHDAVLGKVDKPFAEEIKSLIDLCDDLKNAQLKGEMFHLGELIQILKNRLINSV